MITAVNDGGTSIRFFYASSGFAEGKDVTGYVIYLDLQKSDVFSFDSLGDGIYTVSIPIRRATKSASEKFGVVIKEDGTVVKFEIILLVH